MRFRRLALVLSCAALAPFAAACGDDDEGGGGDGTPAATAPAEEAPGTTGGGDSGSASAEGKAIFTERCSSCHTLADADATGQVGPNLDQVGADLEKVVEQVNNGGGAMPPFRDSLTEEQIQAVSEYVVEARGG